MLQWLKRDFTNVRQAIEMAVCSKTPLWLVVLYYILMLPVGLVLYPVVKIWSWYILSKLKGR